MDELTKANLEFLAAKSREMVEKQIDSHRQKHSKAGVVIGVVTLFIPFFLVGLEDAYTCIQIISVLPGILLLVSIVLMLRVLMTTALYQFFAPSEFSSLANMDYEEVLLFEIGANRDSFNDNKRIDDRQNRAFNAGIWTTIIAIILSVGVLFTNSFYKPEPDATKVEITNK